MKRRDRLVAVLCLAGLIALAACSGKPAEPNLLDRHGQNVMPVRVDSLFPNPEQVCSAAFTAKPQPGKLQGGLRGGMLSLIRSDGSWRTLPEHASLFAATTADLHYLVCIDHKEEPYGYYSSHIPATRVHWDMRLVHWPDGTVLAGRRFSGSEPQSVIQVAPGTSTAHGETPSRSDVMEWLRSLTSDHTLVNARGVSLAFGPGGQRLVLTDCDGGHFWDTATGKEGPKVQAQLCIGGSATALTDDGTSLIDASPAGARTYLIPSGKLVRETKGPWQKFPKMAVIAGNGLTWAAIEETPEGLRVWVLDVQSGAQLHSELVESLESIALSRDGRQLLCSVKGEKPGEHRIEFRQAPAFQKSREFTIGSPDGEADDGVARLALAPNGRNLAMIWRNRGLLEIWDLTSRRLTGIAFGFSPNYSNFVFSPDSQTLAATAEFTVLLPVHTVDK